MRSILYEWGLRFMRLMSGAKVVAFVVLFGASSAAATAATMADVVDATYGGFSVTAPTPDAVFVCHGFGCKYRTEVDLTASDHAKLAQLLAAGQASAAAERRAVAEAGAWFDRRVGPVAGTTNHVVRAGVEHMFNTTGQFDCIDSSRNTTSLLLLLDQLKLLRYHDVDVPVARGLLINGQYPHATAVLTEKSTGIKWSVDSWTVGYGQDLEIMPLERWKTLD
jgi:hypothetical protein